MNESLRARLNLIQLRAGMIGLMGLALCAAGAFMGGGRQFFISYLFGYLFWLGLALGCLGILMLQHLTGGRWGFVVRRFLEAGSMTLPWMALLFLPLFFGLPTLYPWARPAEVAADSVLQHKSVYLNPTAYVGRAVFFFIVWLALAWLLRKWSLQQDNTPDAAPTRRLRTLSGPGIVIYPVTGTFAYIDWVMSAEPDWYSTMFPLIIFIGQFLSAIAFMILILGWFRTEEPFLSLVTSTHFHHLGNLLLTFVMFWTYISFGQLLIIWSGNLPAEIIWYLHRIAGGWKGVVILLFLFHFLLPFFVLLFRATKRNFKTLMIVAGVVFAVHVLSIFWFVAPSFDTRGIRVHWMDFAAPIGVGGVWIAAFIAGLKRSGLLPQNDPRIHYVIPHGN
ncbi:MAG: hypothetical protein JWR26_464 [Pedosphaera sp.]|nr:hypothetical protein [Pedosphaera sp.]